MFVRENGAHGAFPPAVAAILGVLINHGVSFFYNFIGRREYVGRTMKQQIAEPYQRMIPLHFTIIIGAWPVLLLGQPLPALLLLVALKIVMDRRAHLREHAAAMRKNTP